MLVLSRSLVLQHSEAFPPWSPIIGWRSKLTENNVSATSEADDAPASNLATVSTAEVWRATSTDEQHIDIALSDSDLIDYLAVGRHNFGTAQVPASVYGLIDGEWEQLVEDALQPDDEAMIFRFAPQSLAGVRLRLDAGNAPAWAAVIYAGRLTITPPNIGLGFTPLRFGRVYDAASDESESGNFLGRIVFNEFRESTVNLSYLDPAWYRAEFDPFIKAAARRPFFFGWDPLHYPDEVGFASIKPGSNPRPSIQDVYGRMQIELPMRGIA